MKNKKGFTLIELLAVIVVLAIIMVIATIQVNKTIKKSRNDSFELALKSLKRQVEQKMVTGDEYLCYDGRKDDNDKEKQGRLNDLFANNFFAICGGKNNSIDAYEISTNPFESNNLYLTGPLTDYGTTACQNIYDISDDYRMWVTYRPTDGQVSVRLQAEKNGKFSGANNITATIKESENKSATTTSFLENDNFKIKYEKSTRGNQDKNGNTPMLLSGVSIARIKDDKCEYNTTWHHFDQYKDWRYSSYQCSYRWNDEETNKIKNALSTEAENDDGWISIKDACKILVNEDRFANPDLTGDIHKSSSEK